MNSVLCPRASVQLPRPQLACFSPSQPRLRQSNNGCVFRPKGGTFKKGEKNVTLGATGPHQGSSRQTEMGTKCQPYSLISHNTCSAKETLARNWGQSTRSAKWDSWTRTGAGCMVRVHHDHIHIVSDLVIAWSILRIRLWIFSPVHQSHKEGESLQKVRWLRDLGVETWRDRADARLCVQAAVPLAVGWAAGENTETFTFPESLWLKSLRSSGGRDVRQGDELPNYQPKNLK